MRNLEITTFFGGAAVRLEMVPQRAWWLQPHSVMLAEYIYFP